MYSQEFRYTVYELRTGRALETFTRTTSYSLCPKSMSFNSQNWESNRDKLYAMMTDRAVSSALEDTVTSEAK